MSPEEVLAELSAERGVQPRDALRSADSHRDALIEPLLGAIERGIADPTGTSEQDPTLFCYALYLLAKWREPRAYSSVVGWLSLPGEGPFDIAGDIVTQDGAPILAAVCDGDLEPIKALVTNRDANEYARGAAVNALALLAAWAEVPHESIVTYFLWLAREGLEREHSQAWNSLAAESADIEAVPVFPELRRAYDEGLIEPFYMEPSELDEVEAAPRGRQLQQARDHHPPIDDVVKATRWWVCFAKGSAAREQQPSRASSPKVGRK